MRLVGSSNTVYPTKSCYYSSSTHDGSFMWPLHKTLKRGELFRHYTPQSDWPPSNHKLLLSYSCYQYSSYPNSYLQYVLTYFLLGGTLLTVCILIQTQHMPCVKTGNISLATSRRSRRYTLVLVNLKHICTSLCIRSFDQLYQFAKLLCTL